MVVKGVEELLPPLVTMAEGLAASSTGTLTCHILLWPVYGLSTQRQCLQGVQLKNWTISFVIVCT